MAKKIITLEEQKHLAVTFPSLFQDLTTEELSSILEGLGLDQVVNEDGDIIPKYNLDISSNKPIYITKDFNVEIEGILYNYYEDASEKVTSWKWTRDSGNIAEDTTWSTNKTTKKLKLTEADFTDRFRNKDVTFSLEAKVGNLTFTDKITFTKFQSFSKVQIKASNSVFTESVPAVITLEAVTEESVSSYRWFVNNNLVSVNKIFNLTPIQVPLKGFVNIKLEVVTVSREELTDSMTIPRLSSGSDGEPGVPGNPGTNSYTWIRYADDINGLNMSEYPIVLGVAKEYLGLAPNKNTSVESDNPLDYTWSKYIGDDGVPGENGYMWIKYSEFEKGRDLAGNVVVYDTPFIMEENEEGELVREDLVYMGIAYNKQTQREADPNTPEGAPEQYVWAKIKGEDGRTPYLIDLSNDNVSIPANADGTISNPSVAFSLAKTSVAVYYGNETVDRSTYTIFLLPSLGLNYTATNQNHEVQITSLSQDVGQIVFIVNSNADNKIVATGTLSVVKVKGTAIYEISTSVNVVKVINNPGQSPTISPTAIEANVLINNGNTVNNTIDGRLTYKYIYANTPTGSTDDGTVITIGQLLQLDNSGNPLFIEFKYFHPTSNVLVDIERVPFIRDGVAGNSIEQRYRKNTDLLIPPSLVVTDVNPTNWTIAMPTVSAGESLWMTKAVKTGDTGDLVGVWNTPVRITGTPGGPGTPGQPGAPGIQGTTGSIPRLLEFVQGAAYVNGGTYIDYTYYRTSDTSTEGWYTVKLPTGHVQGTEVSKVYTGGIPSSADFNKAPFTKEMSFGTVIAEQANLAGFIFRNQVLQSQAGYNNADCHPQAGVEKKNLNLDGLAGTVSFGDRMIQNKEGILLKDDCGVRRMAFQWVSGIPVLKFYASDGVTVTWEAGQGGYIPYAVETRAPSFIVTQLNLNIRSVSKPVDTQTSFNLIKPKFCYTNDGSGNQYSIKPILEIDKPFMFDKGVTIDGVYPPQDLIDDGKVYVQANRNSSLLQDGWYPTYMGITDYAGVEKPTCNWHKYEGGKFTEEFNLTYSNASLNSVSQC